MPETPEDKRSPSSQLDPSAEMGHGASTWSESESSTGKAEMEDSLRRILGEILPPILGEILPPIVTKAVTQVLGNVSG